MSRMKLLYALRVTLCVLGASIMMVLVSLNSVKAVPAAVDCQAANIQCKKGILAVDEVWTSDNIYVLTNDVTIPLTATLTISAGTIIKGQTGVDLVVEGGLNALGTADKPIYLTSIKDDAHGGDTNQDGATSEPMPGDWKTIQFLGGQGTLSHVEILYIGHNGGSSGSGAAIELQESSPTLNNVAIRHAKSAAISAAATDQPAITNLVVEDVPLGGIHIRPEEITANTTWAITSTPYILNRELSVASGATLTLGEGVIVKMDSRANVTISGTLNINGTAQNPVTVTSIKDDAVGGDSNGDSNASTPDVDDWKNFIFSDGSSGLLTYADFKYGGRDRTVMGAIHIDNASLKITNCVLYKNYTSLYVTGNSASLIVNDCDIYGSRKYGVFNASGTISVDAQNNWWGSNRGPSDNSDADGVSNFSSRGDDVSDHIVYTPWHEARTQPTLEVDTNKLTFNATVNAESAGIETVTITNLASGVLTWTPYEDASWLTLSSTTDTTPSQLNVAVDTAGLTAGTYTEEIVISSANARSSPQKILVELQVVNEADARPIIDVSANTLTFNVAFAGREGETGPGPQDIIINNMGTGTLNWSAAEQISWLVLDETSGVARTLTKANVDISGLSKGTYKEDIVISSANAQNSPVTVQTVLVVGCASAAPIDVILAIDRSASMAKPDISTFQNAQTAANLFIDQVDLSINQLGLVTFESIAGLEAELSTDGEQMKAYVSDLTVENGGFTNMAGAIKAAQDALERSSRRSTAHPVIVLLTDGQDNQGGNLFGEANAAKAQGTQIITIGLGDVNDSSLTAIATSPDDYYPAPTSADLIEIYSRISVNIGCGDYEIHLPTIQR